jgi:hypothetical protein
MGNAFAFANSSLCSDNNQNLSTTFLVENIKILNMATSKNKIHTVLKSPMAFKKSGKTGLNIFSVPVCIVARIRSNISKTNFDDTTKQLPLKT